MNQRIQELAMQATQKFSRFGERDSWEKLFAELIVRECIAWVEEHNGHDGPSISEMKEHFGVEE